MNCYSNYNELIIKTAEHEYSWRDDGQYYMNEEIYIKTGNEKYFNMTDDKIELFKYIFSNTIMKEDMINKVEFATNDRDTLFDLDIYVNKIFANLSDAEKFKDMYMIYNYYCSAGFNYINGKSYNGAGEGTGFSKIIINTTNHQYAMQGRGEKYLLDNNLYTLETSYSFNRDEVVNNMINNGVISNKQNVKSEEIQGELIELGIAIKCEVTTDNNEESKARIIYSVSDYHSKSGVEDVSIIVKNNTDKDITYVKINLFEKKDGKTVNSDWTNSIAVIKPGAEQKITTYFDFRESGSEIEIEFEEVKYN